MSEKFPWKLIIILIFLFNCSGIPIHAQFLRIMSDLDKLNSLTVNEQVYVHTDREVYSTGDTIWLKAYIRNKSSLDNSALSKVFYADLISDRGEIVVEEKYVISNSQSNGFLVVKSDLADGDYTLLCYSSWMKNFDADRVYRRKILVANDIKDDIRFVPHFSKNSYLPGDTVKVIVRYYDNLNNQIEGERFRYTLSVGEKVAKRGASHSKTTKHTPLSFIIPDNVAEIPVLSIWDNTRTADFDVPVNVEIHVDFFPEGGQCLNNEVGTVAFKAVYSSGKPVTISGDIVDEQGIIFSSVRSEHDGMGKFIFTPEKNKKYFLKINLPAGHKDMYLLPEGKENAWSIQAQNYGNKIHVKIRNNTEKFDTCLFMLSIRGYTHYFKLILSESHTTFTIPALKYPVSGIAVLTLLNKDRIPLAERLVFVNHDRFVISDLATEYQTYMCRDSVKLHIDTGDDDIPYEKGQYSLSVFDAVFGSSELIDEPNIISSTYLSPEIKGVIHHPDYYFQSSSMKIAFHLDLLLMTQGWRSYKYNQYVFEVDSVKPPKNQDVILGNIMRTRFGRNPKPTEGNILVYFAGNYQKISTDMQGDFSFIPEYTSEHTSSIILSAKDKKGSDQVIMQLTDEDFQKELIKYQMALGDSVEGYYSLPTYIYEDINKTLAVNAGQSIWIEEVEIMRNKDKEYEDPELSLIKNFSNVRTPSASLLETSNEIDEVILYMGYNCNVDPLTGYLMFNYRGEVVPGIFIVDGFNYGLLYQDVSSAYKPYAIKNLFVVTGVEATLLSTSNISNESRTYNRIVIYIETDKNNLYVNPDEDIIPSSLVIKGLQVSKEFYSPKYRTEEERSAPMLDMRKTIHWNPDTKLDHEGKAVVSFYNSDRYTKIKCVLEGITESGIPVYGETYYDISYFRE